MRSAEADLTNDERELLSLWDNHAYTCACGDYGCATLPCNNDRDDIYATVERIVADRERAARAEAWDEGKHSEHTPACRLGDVPDECTCPNPYREEDR